MNSNLSEIELRILLQGDYRGFSISKKYGIYKGHHPLCSHELRGYSINSLKNLIDAIYDKKIPYARVYDE